MPNSKSTANEQPINVIIGEFRQWTGINS